MARRTSVLVCLALGACYDDPQLALHVERDGDDFNVDVSACNPTTGACSPSEGTFLFATKGSRATDAWFYLDERYASIAVAVRVTEPIEQDAFCFLVELEPGTTVQRTVHARIADPWGCPPDVDSCEVSTGETCP